MKYKASLDKLAKGITFAVFVLLIAIGQISIRRLFVSQGDTTAILIHSGILLLFVMALLGSWLYAARYYSVKNSVLIINRPIGNVKIKLEDIKRVRLLANNEMNGIIRIFGSGGVFGYSGKFHATGFGKMTFYATQQKNRILIVTNNNEKIIITPDDKNLVDKLNIN